MDKDNVVDGSQVVIWIPDTMEQAACEDTMLIVVIYTDRKMSEIQILLTDESASNSKYVCGLRHVKN